MMFDGTLLFDAATPYVPANGLQGINQFASGATTLSTNVLDMLNPRDMGQGPQGKATVQVGVLITSSYLGGTSVNFQLQGSTDNVTYNVYAESGPIPIAQLVAGNNVFNVVIPGVQPDQSQLVPRYYRMAYVNAGVMTAGQVISGLLQTDDNHYYPPGIRVVN